MGWMCTHTTHIYVQTTCKVNFASDDPFKKIYVFVCLLFVSLLVCLFIYTVYEQDNIQYGREDKIKGCQINLV